MRGFTLAVLMMAAGLVSAGTGNIFDGAVYAEALTKESVNFANLEYADTYTVLVFWRQGKVDSGAGETATGGGSGCAPRNPGVDRDYRQ